MLAKVARGEDADLYEQWKKDPTWGITISKEKARKMEVDMRRKKVIWKMKIDVLKDFSTSYAKDIIEYGDAHPNTHKRKHKK